MDQHEAPEEQPGEGGSAVAGTDAAAGPAPDAMEFDGDAEDDADDVAGWETSEQPLVPVRFSANGWPIAIGRASVPSAERLIELELEPAPPPEEREPQPQPSVRTPLAAGLVVVSGLMLAGICGFAMLLPADANVGPGPQTPDKVFVLPAPHPQASTPGPAGTRTAPAPGGGAPGAPVAGGNGGGYLPGNGGGNQGGGANQGGGNQGGGNQAGRNPRGTGGGVPVNQPVPTTAPSPVPPTGGQPTSPTPVQPTTEPPTTQPAPTDTKTTEPSPVAPPASPAADPGTGAPAIAESPAPAGTG